MVLENDVAWRIGKSSSQFRLGLMASTALNNSGRSKNALGQTSLQRSAPKRGASARCDSVIDLGEELACKEIEKFPSTPAGGILHHPPVDLSGLHPGRCEISRAVCVCDTDDDELWHETVRGEEIDRAAGVETC